MMIRYFRFLAGRERTSEANRHLGLTLAFVAGAVNSGGFMAVSQFTSHMTGILSLISEHAALGEGTFVAAGLVSFAAFLAGAATSAILMNWARRKRLHSELALALLLEAALLMLFGVLGHNLDAYTGSHFTTVTVLLLCFVMGLQNAMITKVSGAIIRTTHMTGNATDLGIELGKLFYWNAEGTASVDKVTANREKLALHGSMIGSFVTGGLAGALGFKRLGFGVTVPIAVLLLVIAIVPVWDDLAG